jgi:hypothetical protein
LKLKPDKQKVGKFVFLRSSIDIYLVDMLKLNL